MRKLGTFLLSMLLVALLLTGCTSGYSIKISGDAKLIVDCPTQAKVGEMVTLHTVCIEDAELRVSVNGSILVPLEYAVYEFVMPSEDVIIEVSISTEGYPGA